MNKLSKKLFCRISLAVIVIFVISYILNNYFLYKYYLHEMKANLSKVSEEIEAFQADPHNSKENIEKAIENIEDKYHVTIVYEPLNEDLDYFNESVRYKLNNKNIVLNKFWITEDTIDKLKQGIRVSKLFNQGKIKSSLLVSLIKKENMAVIAGVAITHDSDTIKIINQFYLYLLLFSLVLIIGLIWFFSKGIIKPLDELKEISNEIANLNFTRVNIKTGDEIEELGNSINVMSQKLEIAQNELKEKNENLKTFLSDISHELKTPLALLKAYSMGIKDGLDDGTYHTVILEQADHMSDLVEHLLKLSKLEKDTIQKEVFPIEDVFHKVIEKYGIMIQKEDIVISVQKDQSDIPYIFADQEKTEIVMDNLISNAIKYTANGKIEMGIRKIDNKVLFTIKNGVQDIDKNDIHKIWEPFYVLEASRSKKVSGTGLGLSIVDTILKKHHLDYGCHLLENKIEFYIYYPIR